MHQKVLPTLIKHRVSHFDRRNIIFEPHGTHTLVCHHGLHRAILKSTLGRVLTLIIPRYTCILKLGLSYVQYVLHVELAASEGLGQHCGAYKLVAHASAESGFDFLDLFWVAERQMVDLVFHGYPVVFPIKSLVSVAKIM